MNGIKDGGVAFSYISGNARGFTAVGGNLTVRDCFAMAALQGIIESSSLNEDDAALTAYSYADAMLKAREAKS